MAIFKFLEGHFYINKISGEMLENNNVVNIFKNQVNPLEGYIKIVTKYFLFLKLQIFSGFFKVVENPII